MSRPVRVLELRSVAGTGGGPDKTILAAAKLAAPDVQLTVCYMRNLVDPLFPIGELARDLGLDYVEINERRSLDLSVWPALRRLIRDRRIDIVHAHEYKTDLLAFLLGRAEPVIPLATVHGWTGHSRRERAVYYPVDKRLLARFPRLIAVSGEIKRTLVAAGADASLVDVVLNAIDPQRFRRDAARVQSARAELRLRPGDIVIGGVGRLEPQKRFDLLIQAIAIVRRTRPDVRLLLAGEGSSRAALEAEIVRLEQQEACRLLGHTPDVAGFHHALDLFVQSSDYEGTPNVVLEAMAMETPVVATDVGGTGEIALDGQHAVLLEPGSAEGLAAAIERVLGDPAGARARVAAARQRVEGDLSFERRVRRVEQVYYELADLGPRRRAGSLTAS
jgi:glycosyltransferase involved in cell wall biosynthesis